VKEDTKARKHLPVWMKMERARGEEYSRIKNLVVSRDLHTICTSGNCPNIGECWNRGTATFMILGEICTRSCKFCAVKTGKPLPVDIHEPDRLAETVSVMGIKHCVITSVDRDDLADFGSSVWAMVIRKVRDRNPEVTMEVLIPDFQGSFYLIDRILAESPDIISHNLETVERLTPKIRSRAKYSTSLDVLRFISTKGHIAKSGIMLGLGETFDEVYKTMDDLLNAGVKILTIGQYLQPTVKHIPVNRFIHPDEFAGLKEKGLEKGFIFVESGPLVRSSYHADKQVAVSVLNRACKD